MISEYAGTEGKRVKREKARRSGEFVLFEVLYEDGTRSSNRKVPSSELGSLDEDRPAKPYIEAQIEKSL